MLRSCCRLVGFDVSRFSNSIAMITLASTSRGVSQCCERGKFHSLCGHFTMSGSNNCNNDNNDRTGWKVDKVSIVSETCKIFFGTEAITFQINDVNWRTIVWQRENYPRMLGVKNERKKFCLPVQFWRSAFLFVDRFRRGKM